MLAVQIVAGVIFLLTFVAILSGKVNRTIAALAGATVMVTVGHFMGFYDEPRALAAIDFDTIGLLLGMMIIVVLLEECGLIRYTAILVAKWSMGKPWLLLVVLGTATTLASMVLDNVTVIILVGSVTILICELLGIGPVPFLIAEALLADTGGVASLVGDPPNIIIGAAAGFTFVDFLTHLGPIVLVAWAAALLLLRFIFRRELAQAPTRASALGALDARQALQDPAAMRKILVILAGIVTGFLLEPALGLSPSFCALAGAVAALVWIRPDIKHVLRQVDWAVLIFFAALFVLVGGVEASQVIQHLADGVADLAQRYPVLAGITLLWAAALISAVVDNVPFTIAMVPIIKQLGALGIPTASLWWALALGAGFGGNGTLIGSTANVVTVALSEKTSTPITSRTWMKSGLPVMIVTCIIASILYALLFSWMSTSL